MQTEVDMDIIILDSDEENDQNENKTTMSVDENKISMSVEKDNRQKETRLFAKIENKDKSNNTPAFTKQENLDSEDDSDDDSSEESLVEESSSLSKSPEKTYSYLDKAMEDIKNGGTLTLVALRYGIPRHVLFDKIFSRGRPDVSTLLTRADEDNLVKWILRANKSDTLVFKSQLLEKVGKFKKISRISRVFHKSKYGLLWYYYFMSSHPEIYENEGLLLKCETLNNKSVRKQPVERRNRDNSKEEIITNKENKSPRRLIEKCNGERNGEMDDEIFTTKENKSVRRQPIERCNGENSNDEMMTTVEVSCDQGVSNLNIDSKLLSSLNIKKAVVVLQDYRKENESNGKKGNMYENSEAVKRIYNADCTDYCMQSNGDEQKARKTENKQETSIVNQDSKSSSFVGKDVLNTLYLKYKKRRIEIENDSYKATCKICNKTFINKNKLARHFLRVHNNGKPQTPVKCSTCFKLFSSEYRLNVHVSTMHNYKYYKCNKCDDIFKHITSIKNHYKKKHSADKFSPLTLFICDICGQRFKFKNSLEHHIINEHQKNEKEHCCEICQKTFTKSSNLKRHKTFHNKRSFICAGCGKTYFNEFLLSKHMTSCSTNHQTDIDLECDRISREYLEEINLD